jgi:hypothetical protein
LLSILLKPLPDEYSNLETKPIGDDMTTPLKREEIDAKLAATEARGETSFVELSGKMDRIIDAVGRSSTELGEINQRIESVN